MNPEIDALPLRDIHLPDAVSWWPLAPGWWMVIAIMLLLSLTVVLWRYWRNQGRLRRQALSELKHIVTEYRELSNEQKLVNRLSVLLRRLSLSAYPGSHSAGLTGQAWLRFLDDVNRNNSKTRNMPFSTPSGKLLITVPYVGSKGIENKKNNGEITQSDVSTLIALCRDWISALPSAKTINRQQHLQGAAIGGNRC